VLPKKITLATVASVVNPPVPVYVNPVAVAIDNTVVVAVGWFNTILPVPKLIERVLELFELNIPVVKVNPAKFNVPLVNVVDAVLSASDNASANVVVPDVLLIVNAAIVLVFVVIVPVPTITAVSPVNVPPLDSVRLPLIDKEVVPRTNAVVPKLRLLNQLLELSVTTAVPLPVSVKFGELVAEPPVVPNVNVLVIEASVVKPPVPVLVKLVAFAIDNTVVAAVVCANTMLPVPNEIDLATAPVELAPVTTTPVTTAPVEPAPTDATAIPHHDVPPTGVTTAEGAAAEHPWSVTVRRIPTGD
jgi:hypothetical protein